MPAIQRYRVKIKKNLNLWIELLIIFFFNDTATTEIYTLSLHDALPIYGETWAGAGPALCRRFSCRRGRGRDRPRRDRKSTRLNSSHVRISYAVFCLKKKTTLSLLAKKLLRLRITRHVWSTNLRRVNVLH